MHFTTYTLLQQWHWWADPLVFNDQPWPHYKPTITMYMLMGTSMVIIIINLLLLSITIIIMIIIMIAMIILALLATNNSKGYVLAVEHQNRRPGQKNYKYLS